MLVAWALAVLLAGAIPGEAAGDYSRYDFNYHYNDGSGDYYTGYVYAPTAFTGANNTGPIQVGTHLTTEPEGLGSKALNGYYEITGITGGFDASYDKKSYITSYYDADFYHGSEGVNSDGSAVASAVYVANRAAAHESGYVVNSAAQIGNIPVEYLAGTLDATNVSGTIAYEITYAYDIGFFAEFSPYQEADGPTLKLDIDIQLVGDDPGDALKNTWMTGIEGAWNDKYEIQYGSNRYPVEVNVDWVAINPDITVTVHDAVGRDDELNWYTTLEGWGNSYQGVAAAHEFGHMMGLYDEYPEGAVNPVTKYTTTNALMADFGPVRLRYYDLFLTWMRDKTGIATLSLVAAAPAPAAPESACSYAGSFSVTSSEVRSEALSPYPAAPAPGMPLPRYRTNGAVSHNQAIWSSYWSETARLLEEENYW